MSVWRTCWQQGRTPREFVICLLRGTKVLGTPWAIRRQRCPSSRTAGGPCLRFVRESRSQSAASDECDLLYLSLVSVSLLSLLLRPASLGHCPSFMSRSSSLVGSSTTCLIRSRLHV